MEEENLHKGNYQLEFINLFGQRIQKDIYLAKLNTKIKVCIDEFKNTGEETFFQKLMPEDILKLSFSSSGCSHWEVNEINFSRIDNGFFGELIEEDKPSLKIKLNNSHLQYLIIFERKLRQIKNSDFSCTTEDRYQIKMGREVLEIIDETCDWNGYYKMRKEIFNLDYIR